MTMHAEVIGDPIAQSKSPVMHGFWLQKLGLDGRYHRTRVEGGELAAFLESRRRDPDWRGCNVTIPHKVAVMPLLDRVEPQAAAIGAVNTIVPCDGALIGSNTDAGGFLEPLRERLASPDLWRVARVLGSGGAARAIAHALAGEGFTIVLIARDEERARALVGELPGDHHTAPLSALAEPLDFDWGDQGDRLDLLVNATSLGMTGQPPLAVHPDQIPPGAIVYDAVYAPLETPLLAMARARGHAVIDGLSMLIGQGAAAFERFYGVRAPRAHDAELRALLTA